MEIRNVPPNQQFFVSLLNYGIYGMLQVDHSWSQKAIQHHHEHVVVSPVFQVHLGLA